jgi:hypothetical protein
MVFVVQLSKSEADGEEDAVPDAKKGAQATHQGQKPKSKWWARLIYDIKSELHKGEAERKEENPQDRSSRRTANATVWIAVVTAAMTVFSGLTLLEIYWGGADTHKLAESTLAASRAWVVVQGTGFGFTQDKNFPTGRVILADSGESPAFGMEGWRCVEVRADEPPLQNGILQKSNTGICLSIAGGTLGKGVPITMDAFVPAIAPDGFAKDTDWIGPHFYYWGIVTYDIYPSDGKRHSTSFCLKNGGSQLSACRESGYQTD